MFKQFATRGALALSVFALAVGCGDGAICPSEIVVVFQGPTGGGSLSSLNDSDPAAAGVQSDVTVRSNLKKGDEFVLTVTDSSNAVSQVTAEANSEGDVNFASVTLPAGDLTLAVTGTSGKGCGSGSDEIEITVITQAACDLTIANGPIDNDFFAPIPVLNSTNDDDAGLPNFQATLEVASAEGFEVEVFVLDVGAGSEASIGTATVNSTGVASFSSTLAQGRQAVRATCSKGAVNEASATSTVEVDTVVPSCQLTTPAEGVTVTPDDDTDGNISNGIQMTWVARVDDGSENDTEGEAAAFFRNALEFSALPVDDAGNSASELAEFTSPGSFAMAFSTQDHAGNPCTDGFDVDVILEGCSIAITEPSAIVLADSDANDANGMQSNVTVAVGTECAGQDVFVDCGQGEISATAPAGGVTVVSNVTLDTNASSEGTATCNARVVNTDNFQTTDARPVSWDTEAPGVNLVLVSPAGMTCGDSLARSVANDADSNLANGFQIAAAVSAPLATTRELRVTNSGGTATSAAPAGGVAVNITLLPGDNDVRAIAGDINGNIATTVPCNIVVEDITVDFDPPFDDGIVGIADGTINGGGQLELPICVTVSETTVTVTITVDGGAPLSTTLAGGSFCTDVAVPLTEGTRSLVANAASTLDTRQGSASLNVIVDLTPPGGATTLLASSSDHQSIDVSWDAQAGVTNYLVRFSTSTFSTNPAVFLTQGENWPGAIIAETTQIIGPIDTGTAYFVGVVGVDAAGNMSNAASSTAVTPAYDDTGAFSPILADFNPATQRGPNFGMRHARGDFNNDGFDDIAIAAPFNVFPFGAVFIYFGSVTGITVSGIGATTPDVIIQATTVQGFGNSIARLNWSGAAGDGLAIGAPFPAGAVFIYHSATIAAAAGGTLGQADRDVQIAIQGGPTDYFTGGRMGWSLTSGQIDANGTPDDLVIGVPRGGINGGKSATTPGGDGGVVIIYGGTITAGQDTLTLSSNPANANTQGLAAHIFENPQTTVSGSTFANELAYLGDTRVGNGVGDVAIAYFADQVANTTDNVVFVLRGRTSPAPGIAFTTFATGTDLKIINPTPDLTNEFGISMGSIADMSGDGFRDIVIGGRSDNETNDGTAVNEGRVWIIAGSRTDTLTLNGVGDYLTKISSLAAGTRRVGGGIANNALAASPDVNGDGFEDLVLSAGAGDLRVWFGGPMPTGDIAATTANYVIPRPPEFSNSFAGGFPAMVPVTWLGDINGDGLTDLGRGDWSAGPNAKGIFDILWDE